MPATITVVDNVVTITAGDDAQAAAASANAAAASAAVALTASGPNYATDAAGRTAVADGGTYALDDGSGLIAVKQRVDASTSTTLRNYIKDYTAATAAALIGLANISGVASVQEYVDLIATTTHFSTTSVGIGTASLTARLAIKVETAFIGDGLDLKYSGDQSTVDHQYACIKIHNYTNAKGFVVDNCGAKTAVSIKQAINTDAWPGSDVGTGDFVEMLRARVDGLGTYPTGNLGGNVDKLTFFNTYGNLCFYGSDAQNWDLGSNTAPIQIATYDSFLQRKGYLGYDHDGQKFVIGAIDTNAGIYTSILLQAATVATAGGLTVTGNLGVGNTSPSAKIHSTVADGTLAFGLSGTTKGIRVEMNSTSAVIRGVDSTLGATYQPLTIGGSQVVFQVNGSTEVLRFNASGYLVKTGGFPNYADDAAAAAGGVPLNALYRNGSVVQIRVA